MNRSAIIKVLKDMAGPLGPFVSISSIEDLEKLRSGKYSDVSIGDLGLIIDIVLNPPLSVELGKVTPDDFKYELVQMLTIIGRKDVNHFLSIVKELLYINKARPIIIDVLGGIGHEDGIFLLEPILELDLIEDEIIRLSNAFSGIGGLKATEILNSMKAKFSNSSPEVLSEIDISLSVIKG